MIFPKDIIYKLSNILASSDKSSSQYVNGDVLVEFFNLHGCNDSYVYENGIGICSPDLGESLSRITYVRKRLEMFNNQNKIDNILEDFPRSTKEPRRTQELISGIIPQFLSTENTTESPSSHLTTDNLTTAGKRKNRKVEKVLGEIPEDAKVVFISYSWDSEDHKEWVLSLAQELAKYHIYVLLDRYNKTGSIVRFMQEGIKRADKIIIVGTPGYKKKQERLSGGVAFEEAILSAKLYYDLGFNKIIPVLRSGSFESSFDLLSSTNFGCDFSDDTKFNDGIQELVRKIWDMPSVDRPELGPLPKF